MFEAEPLEGDAMTARPRRPDQRLFDAAVIGRGLWQGAGLLMLLLAVYSGVRLIAGSDEMARALTFEVLVLSNLGLIHANRSWSHASWRDPGASNTYFGWITLATLALLGCVLGIPEISRLFAFAPPTPVMLVAGAGMALISLLWFEGVKWGSADADSPCAERPGRDIRQTRARCRR